jgi:hypothetical protein
MRTTIIMLAAVPMALAGCNTTTPTPVTQAPVPTAMMDESVPQVARTACLAEVNKVTGGTQPQVIGEMVYSEAGSRIKVLVGPQRAPWQCTVANSGIAPQVMSLTNEGAL